MQSIALRHAMIPIVQQNDIPATSTAQALNYRFGRFRFPIARGHTPHRYAGIASPRHDAAKQRVAISVGRPHPSCFYPRGRRNRFVASVQFFRHSRRRQPHERRVRLGVVPNFMPAPGDFPRQRRKGSHLPPNQEKCRLNLVLRQQFE